MSYGPLYRVNSATACKATGRSYYSYGARLSKGEDPPHPDAEGRVACPVCGKVIKLKMNTLEKRFRTIIPWHKPQRHNPMED